MSSAIAKVGKSQQSLSKKNRTTQSKKAVPKKPKKLIGAGSSKGASTKRVIKKAAPVRKPRTLKGAAKKASAKKPVGKRAPEKRVVKSGKKTSNTKRPMRIAKPLAKATGKQALNIRPAPPAKRVPAPETVAAVRAFEDALKVFNRHDFVTAKSSFENLLIKFGEQQEVIAGVRPYLAICEQRLAKVEAVPRTAEALYNRGVLEYNNGNTQNAISLFEKALKSEPRADHIMYSLAAAYARSGDVAKTLDYLRRAIVVRPVHRSHARRDPDFNSLHPNEDFQELVGLGLDLLE